MEESSPVNHSRNKITPRNWINYRIKAILEERHCTKLGHNGKSNKFLLIRVKLMKAKRLHMIIPLKMQRDIKVAQ